MNQPALDLLLEKVNNKYTLVVKAAKRARQITENEIIDPKTGEKLKGKPVTLALYEIANTDTEEKIYNIGNDGFKDGFRE
jgi:DNA-directed RNA polymerase subunit omega